MDQIESTPPAPAQQLGLGARILLTFTEPTRLFERLRENPSWLLVFVVAALIKGAAAWVIFPVQTAEVAGFMEDSKFMQLLPEAQQEETLEQMRNPPDWKRHIAPVQAIVGWLFMLLVGSVLLYGAQRVLGGDAGFKAMLAVASHAFLIVAVRSLVLLPLQLTKESFVMVTLSPAILLDVAEPTTNFMLLGALDVFMLWATVVLGMGVSIVGRISGTAGYAVSFTLYLLLVGFSVGMTSLFL